MRLDLDDALDAVVSRASRAAFLASRSIRAERHGLADLFNACTAVFASAAQQKQKERRDGCDRG